MIQRPNAQFVCRHPGPVAAGAPLTVGADDRAFVVRNGRLERVLAPGSYEVPPEFAGPGVEIHFVSVAWRRDVKFGGPLPAGLPARMVYGTFAYHAADPERLLVATMMTPPDDFDRFVATRIQKAAADLIAKKAVDGTLDPSTLAAEVAGAAALGEIGLSVEIAQVLLK